MAFTRALVMIGLFYFCQIPSWRIGSILNLDGSFLSRYFCIFKTHNMSSHELMLK